MNKAWLFCGGLGLLAVHLTLLAQPSELRFEISSISLTSNVREGTYGLLLTFQAVGGNATSVRASRITITKSEDDHGKELLQTTAPQFYYISVGGDASDHSNLTGIQAPTVFLSSPSPGAETLTLLQGRAEAIIPDRDPDPSVVINAVSKSFGRPLESDALKKAGITVALFNKAQCEKFKSEHRTGGPADYDDGPMFGASMPMPPEMQAIPSLAHQFDL